MKEPADVGATAPDQGAISWEMNTVLQGKGRRALKAVQRLSGHRLGSLEGARHPHPHVEEPPRWDHGPRESGRQSTGPKRIILSLET